MFGRRGWLGPRGLGRVAAVGAALFFAVGLTLAPPGARPASAATGELLTSAAASYIVDLPNAIVRVSVAVTLVNDKPSDASYSYFWRDLSWAVQPEATSIRVRDEAGALEVTAVPEDGFVNVQFRLRRDLQYRQSVGVTITWDLPGGAPRSDSTVRVGEAFAAFDIWAWGDAGSSSVTAVLPAGFEVETFGSDVENASGPNGVTLSAFKIVDPIDFWTAVTAVRERSYASDELTLPGGISLRIRGWPEDDVWRTKVSTTLRRGLPELRELIGLPWPVEKRLDVTEVYAPLLEGYAGIYYTGEQRIEISEDLDDLTVVHEGSHAWFNDDLFTDRWIAEGLADTYAAVVVVRLGEDRQSPEIPRTTDEGHVDLLSWTFPGRVTDETVERELYGYNASWWVVNGLYEEVGPGRMRAIFQAAHDDTIAYLGAGEPETVGATDTWRRFLDLLEEVGGSMKADGLVRDFVATPYAMRELDARAEARAAYAALVDAGDDWLPPIYVRSPMGAWTFVEATVRIDEATAVLELRDEVAAAAVALDVQPGDALEAAYESASDGLGEAESVGRAQLSALASLDAASEAVTAEPDLIASIGLLGATPGAAYDEAAAAFEAGDLDEAEDAARAALALIEDAPRTGRERLAGVAIGATVLLAAALFVARGRARRVTTRTAALIEPPAGVEPYATLAADPPALRPGADGAAGPEGGTVDGEESSAPS